MSIIDWIKDEANELSRHTSSKCAEHDCRLAVNGIQRCVILKAEELPSSEGKMCDCIVFWESQKLVIAAVELKSKATRASGIHEQVQNGSLKALEIVRSYKGESLARDWYPAILAKRWRSKEGDVLRGKTIHVDGIKLPIIAKSCGTHLRDLVED